MTLDRRLTALRRQAGGLPAVAEKASEPSDLKQRMRRLRPESRRDKGAERSDEPTVAALVGGAVLGPGVIVVDRVHRKGARHGRCQLGFAVDDLAALPEANGLERDDLLFLDTETSGLAGGSGTAVFVLGLARFRGRELMVRQYLLTAFCGEERLYADMTQWAEGVEALVSYNGKSFDVPLLATRCRLAGLRDEFSRRRHVDLLHATRRAFGGRWPDCRLARAERLLLGFEREDDLPGSEAPQAWFDWLHRADPRRLPDVLRHNHLDLVSLAALLPVLAETHAEPDRYAADRLAIARYHRRSGSGERAWQTLSQSRDSLEMDELLEFAALARRRRDWQSACAIWHILMGQGCAEAAEHLAKYFEHVEQDYARALSYTELLPDGVERRRRADRLLRKRDRGARSFSTSLQTAEATAFPA